ncbi:MULTISPECIES: LysR substrate-binding domain-containing protein [unclassified Vibrio]|uniref:LysR substrate-binding domain-containing protein n=1 Tax=Vibrio sp. HB236076 TaxID=3232307 RepID=A0AB39HJ02_9VIBR|nr:LysR substrate-binding domain-containing protein [Vibrio sp. HB161653]MDP5252985.1 LysR substrate-binding domain-containing protein [Vibrio sp. HB161653]
MKLPISLDALSILDTIERRGSFAAASQELNKATSSLTYQIQKLEQDLDILIYDRSGYKATLTPAGQLLLERGRAILQASEQLVFDATALANGWELDLTLAYDGLLPVDGFFPLLRQLETVAPTRVKLQEEILSGCLEALQKERADLLVCPDFGQYPSEIKTVKIGQISTMWVASPEHAIHFRRGELNEQALERHRIIAIADTAQDQPAMSVNVLQKQPRLTVSTMTAKVQALQAGLGIGTLPVYVAKPLIDSGKLRNIEALKTAQDYDLILAWKRNTMGKSKTWCIEFLTRYGVSHL